MVLTATRHVLIVTVSRTRHATYAQGTVLEVVNQDGGELTVQKVDIVMVDFPVLDKTTLISLIPTYNIVHFCSSPLFDDDGDDSDDNHHCHQYRRRIQ